MKKTTKMKKKKKGAVLLTRTKKLCCAPVCSFTSLSLREFFIHSREHALFVGLSMSFAGWERKGEKVECKVNRRSVSKCV